MGIQYRNNSTSQIEFYFVALHPKELELIMSIREKFQYGEITIKTRQGLPFRVVRTIEYDDLDKQVENLF